MSSCGNKKKNSFPAGGGENISGLWAQPAFEGRNMLKDITLGQFFPGDSLLHKLDPRIKLALTVFYIVALFMSKSVFSYAIMLLFLITAVAISGISPRVVLKGMKPLVFIIVFTSILNIFYAREGNTLWTWWIFTVTSEGIAIAFFTVARIIMLVTGTFVLLTYTTSPIALTDAIERVMRPLAVIKVPVHELAMMMTIALRFIPTLIDETDKIMNAQKARGADFESGNVLRRAKALIPLLIPLFVSAIRRAEELATAMECRCYHGGEGRTRMKQLRLAPLDLVFFPACLAVFSSAAALGWFGL